jgi:hypothetical protein
VHFTDSVTFDDTAFNLVNADTLSNVNTEPVWILQIAQDVIVGSGAAVVLAGGAKAENIFWQVAGTVDVGTSAHLEGIFLGKTNMAFKTGSSLNGAALAQTAVTLDAVNIVKKSEDDRRMLRGGVLNQTRKKETVAADGFHQM